MVKEAALVFCVGLPLIVISMDNKFKPFSAADVANRKLNLPIGPHTIARYVERNVQQTHNWPHYQGRTANAPTAHPAPGHPIDINLLMQELNAHKVSDAEFDRSVAEAQRYNASL